MNTHSIWIQEVSANNQSIDANLIQTENDPTSTKVCIKAIISH